MAYTPTNWECGDVVTAELLNKLEGAVEDLSIAIDGEGGGGSEPLILTRVSSRQEGNCTITTYNHTWSEVIEAFHSGKGIFLGDSSEVGDIHQFLQMLDTPNVSDGYILFGLPNVGSGGVVSITAITLAPNEISGVMESTLCSDQN